MRLLEYKVLRPGGAVPRFDSPMVFTDIHIDILSARHVAFLQAARHKARCQLVGLYSSPDLVKHIDTCFILAALESVDYVMSIDEDWTFDIFQQFSPQIWCADPESDGLEEKRVNGAKKRGIEIATCNLPKSGTLSFQQRCTLS